MCRGGAGRRGPGDGRKQRCSQIFPRRDSERGPSREEPGEAGGLQDLQQVGDGSLCHGITAGHRGQSEPSGGQDVASLQEPCQRSDGNQMKGRRQRGTKGITPVNTLCSLDVPGTALGAFLYCTYRTL